MRALPSGLRAPEYHPTIAPTSQALDPRANHDAHDLRLPFPERRSGSQSIERREDGAEYQSKPVSSFVSPVRTLLRTAPGSLCPVAWSAIRVGTRQNAARMIR